MKFKSWFTPIILCFLILTSCSTTSDVVNERYIQKRKYRKGYAISKRTPVKNELKEKEHVKKDSNSNTPSVGFEADNKTVPSHSPKRKKERAKSKKEIKAGLKESELSKLNPIAVNEALTGQVTVAKEAAKKQLKKQIKVLKKDQVYSGSRKTTEAMGVVGFFLALLGLVVAGIIFGTAAIILGVLSLGKIDREENLKGRGFAVIAIIVGLIDVVAVLLILSTL